MANEGDGRFAVARPDGWLVFGASSQIGIFMLRRLTQAGVPVVAVSRSSCPPQPGVRWLKADIDEDSSLTLAGPYRAIASFAPMQFLAAWLSRLAVAPARCLVATSSMSALSKIASPEAAERTLAESLLQGERALFRQCRRLGMACIILRPTLIYGAGVDRSLTPVARRAMAWRLFPLPCAVGLRQPVHADDIALAVLAAEASSLREATLQIGGGERLTYLEMFRRVRRSLPVRTLPVPIPMTCLRLLAWLRPGLRGVVARLSEDLVADIDDLQRVLGVRPRGFQPGSEAWLGLDVDGLQ